MFFLKSSFLRSGLVCCILFASVNLVLFNAEFWQVKWRQYEGSTVAIYSTLSQNLSQQVTRTQSLNSSQNVTKWLTFFPDGGLGNRLFQYAATYCIAKLSGRKLFLSDTSVLKNFPLYSTVTFLPSQAYGLMYNKSAKKGTRQKAMTYDGVMVEDVRSAEDESVITCCYTQSWRYFKSCEEEIRQQFSPPEPMIAELDLVLQQVLQMVHNPRSGGAPAAVACIHVRRDDFLVNQKLGFTVSSLKYLTSAMVHMDAIVPNSVFLVFSDDPTWCEANMLQLSPNIVIFSRANFPKLKHLNVHFPGLKDYGQQLSLYEMMLRSRCNHSIITAGTYSWWGGWLAGGVTVYDKTHPPPDSPVGRTCDRGDYYPPDWIAL